MLRTLATAFLIDQAASKVTSAADCITQQKKFVTWMTKDLNKLDAATDAATPADYRGRKNPEKEYANDSAATPNANINGRYDTDYMRGGFFPFVDGTSAACLKKKSDFNKYDVDTNKNTFEYQNCWPAGTVRTYTFRGGDTNPNGKLYTDSKWNPWYRVIQQRTGNGGAWNGQCSAYKNILTTGDSSNYAWAVH